MKMRLALLLVPASLSGCADRHDTAQPAAASGVAVKRDTPPPPLDPNNIVSIASASKDHVTLVAALKAADYVRSVANPGPLTVFAPTDAAFAKLPAGVVDGLMQPEKQADLKEILKYHATTSAWELAALKDGMQLGMANGKKLTVSAKDGKVQVNGANVVASVRASNGMVHVIDAVLLPPAR